LSTFSLEQLHVASSRRGGSNQQPWLRYNDGDPGLTTVTWIVHNLVAAHSACLANWRIPLIAHAGGGMPGREKILDPTGFGERSADTTLAPRPTSIRGLRVGLLENTKPNAAPLLSNVGRELQRQHGAATAVMFAKSYFGTPTEESLIQRILHNCDFVVAGIGD
jgi:hypothetical protein